MQSLFDCRQSWTLFVHQKQNFLLQLKFKSSNCAKNQFGSRKICCHIISKNFSVNYFNSIVHKNAKTKFKYRKSLKFYCCKHFAIKFIFYKINHSLWLFHNKLFDEDDLLLTSQGKLMRKLWKLRWKRKYESRKLSLFQQILTADYFKWF